MELDKILKNGGNDIMPRTKAELVKFANGETLEDQFADLTERVEELEGTTPEPSAVVTDLKILNNKYYKVFNIDSLEDGIEYDLTVTARGNVGYTYISTGNGSGTKITSLQNVNLSQGDSHTWKWTKLSTEKTLSIINTSGQALLADIVISHTQTSANSSEKISKSEESMSSGDSIQFYVPNIKKDKVISFFANVTTMGIITIKNDNNDAYYRKGWIKIDDTNVYIGDASSSSATAVKADGTLPHSLTINTFINVILELDSYGAGKLTVMTLGGKFTATLASGSYYGCKGRLVVSSDGSALTNCSLSFGSKGLDCDTWAYGDSYFDYWLPVALTNGFTNVLCDGYSGRKSVDALFSLKKELAIHKAPKRILWCMGMNDMDNKNDKETDAAEEVNAWYKSCVDELVSICNKYKIELLLCTIPNCINYTSGKSYIHTYKNAYIKTLGCRIVDLASAVGADGSSDWYNGLRGTNDIHPSKDSSGHSGSDVIAYRVMADVPEMKG